MFEEELQHPVMNLNDVNARRIMMKTTILNTGVMISNARLTIMNLSYIEILAVAFYQFSIPSHVLRNRRKDERIE